MVLLYPVRTLFTSQIVKFTALSRPTVLYSNNHILVVNKPPGWHSIPNNENSNNPNGDDDDDRDQDSDDTGASGLREKKCLLSFLKGEKLGGGTKGDVLYPLHRLDQPVSGVLILGKTRRAASRIQSNWSIVQKVYYAVLAESNNQNNNNSNSLLSANLLLHRLRARSQPRDRLTTANHHHSKEDNDSSSSSLWYTLQGYMLAPQRHKNSNAAMNDDSTRGWSMRVAWERPPFDASGGSGRRPSTYPQLVQLDWRVVVPYNETTLSSISPPFKIDTDTPRAQLIQIQTKTGARHQIRALLASAGAPLAGDLRYQDAAASMNDDYYYSSREDQDHSSRVPMAAAAAAALPDQSVALHAYSLQLPETLPLGEQLTQRLFQAPLPGLWKKWWGLDNSMIKHHD